MLLLQLCNHAVRDKRKLLLYSTPPSPIAPPPPVKRPHTLPHFPPHCLLLSNLAYRKQAESGAVTLLQSDPFSFKVSVSPLPPSLSVLVDQVRLTRSPPPWATSSRPALGRWSRFSATCCCPAWSVCITCLSAYLQVLLGFLCDPVTQCVFLKAWLVSSK